MKNSIYIHYKYKPTGFPVYSKELWGLCFAELGFSLSPPQKKNPTYIAFSETLKEKLQNEFKDT